MDDQAARLLNAQGGVASVDELLAAGISRERIGDLVRSKDLVRVRQGALVLGQTYREAKPWEQRTLVARAVGHDLARADGPVPSVHALSHESALLVRGLPTFGEDGLVHLARTDGTRGRRQRGLWVHQPVDQAWVEEVDGLRVVTPTLAALQVAALHGVEAGLVALDGVLHQAAQDDLHRTGRDHDVGVREVRRQIDEAIDDGLVRAVRIVRQVVDLADRRSESAGESRTRWLLHTLGFGPFDPQFVVREGSVFHGRCDLRLRRWPVIIEFDGGGKYDDDPLSLRQEKRREDAIRALGYVVVRLSWDDLARPELVRSKVQKAIELAVQLERAGA